MIDTIKAVLENTQNRTPMVHSITNNVTINDCANIILAAGGTAIMAQDEREVEEITSHAQALVINMGAVRAQEAMLLTGAMDVITDGTRTAVVRGGSAYLRRITGAGCMLTSLTGVYCGANPDILLEAAVTASEVMKHCGETAEARVRKEMEGTASFRTRLIDAVSLLNADELTPNLCLQIL